MNNEKFDCRIEDVNISKTQTKCKKNYRNIRKYDVILINDKERLIKAMNHDNDSIRYFVKNGELFNILHSTHIAIGNGGRDCMMAEIKLKYCNITKETIIIFSSLYTESGLVSKPILHSAYNSHTQIDLIDMQLQSKNNYRFIMNYQDYLTKFVILKPLKTKRAEEIAYNLMEFIQLLKR